jgi:hypothetical protein
VTALDIASDVRLAPFRLEDTQRPAGVRRGRPKKGPDSAEHPVAVTDAMRAAVNAGSLISFVAGLNAEEKSDVLFSTQLAQRAASAKHDRFAKTEDWYGVYVDVLERVGWIGEGFAFTDRGSSSGEFSMDKSALDVIATIATGNQLAILVKTLDTLKKLGDDDRALRIFDIQAMTELSGNFQIGAVQKAAWCVPLHDVGPSREISFLEMGRGGDPLLDRSPQDVIESGLLCQASECRYLETCRRRSRLCC